MRSQAFTVRPSASAVRFDIGIPETVTLTIGVPGILPADAGDSLHDVAVIQGRLAKFPPVVPLAPRNDVVDGSQGKFPVIQVPMLHVQATLYPMRPHCSPMARASLLSQCVTTRDEFATMADVWLDEYSRSSSGGG